MQDSEQTGEKTFKIKRGRVDSLSLYEITEHELNVLENGSPSSLLLNFSLVLLPTATSFLITLLTTTIQSDRMFSVFVMLVICGYISGLILLILWWRNRKSITGIVSRIRDRIPQEEQTEGENSPETNQSMEGNDLGCA